MQKKVGEQISCPCCGADISDIVSSRQIVLINEFENELRRLDDEWAVQDAKPIAKKMATAIIVGLGLAVIVVCVYNHVM